MKKFFRDLYKDLKGFTLVELLVVIVVISVLSGAGVPTYVTLTNRAKEKGTQSDMKNTALALELHKSERKNYPDADKGIEFLEISGYRKNVPLEDLWENQYNYISVDGSSYRFQSAGLDGVLDTEDDIIFQDGVLVADGAFGDDVGWDTIEPPTFRGLVSSWDFADVVNDSIGEDGFQGDINGANLIIGGGRNSEKNGLRFNGGTKNNLVISPSQEIQLSGDMSFSLWFNLENIPSTGKDTLFTCTTSGEKEIANTQYELRINKKGYLFYSHEYNNGKNENIRFKNTGIESGSWNMLTLTRDSNTKLLKVYLNGSIIGESEYINDPTGGDNTSLYIASDRANTKRCIDGTIDEFALYNDVLEENEIAEYYEYFK